MKTSYVIYTKDVNNNTISFFFFFHLNWKLTEDYALSICLNIMKVITPNNNPIENCGKDSNYLYTILRREQVFVTSNYELKK